jgi:hypothetical protein
MYLDQQGRCKWHLHLKAWKAWKANEVLQVRVLLNLRYGLFVTQAQFMFDDHRADDQASIFRRTTLKAIH